jgi:hypothetical protein
MRGVYDYQIYKAMRVGRRMLACIVVFLMIVSFSGDTIVAETKTETENAMRLTGGSGTISVTGNNGKKDKVTSKMRLSNGSTVATASRSYAYVSLDSTKTIKLDALTKAEVRKRDTRYAVLLNSGNLFFNVTSPLTETETFNIRTSNMNMTIKGTCAQVEVIDSRHTRVCLLEGSLHCKLTSFRTGESKTLIMLAGQAADFYLNGESQNDCKIVTEEITADAIRGFVLAELYRDKNLAAKVYQQSGLDFRSLTQSDVDARLRKDQNKAGTSAAKAKDNSKRAMHMDFLEDHEEGKVIYTTEGDVTIIPENICLERLKGPGCPGTPPAPGSNNDQNNNSGSNDQNNNQNKDHGKKTERISGEMRNYNDEKWEIKIPSPNANTVIRNYFDDL